MDGSSNAEGAGAGILLINPEGRRIGFALRFGFKASNNNTEYEALIARLRLADELTIQRLNIFSDSQLMVAKWNGNTEPEKTIQYIAYAHELAKKIDEVNINHIPRALNVYVNALLKLASSCSINIYGKVYIDILSTPNISQMEVVEIVEEHKETWMTQLSNF